MKAEEWARKYRAALTEQIPVLQPLRDEAYVAVMGRMKEVGQTGDDERRRLNNTIETLDRAYAIASNAPSILKGKVCDTDYALR